jgi:hypothetical protein
MSAVLPAHAQEAATLEPKAQNGVSYISGGVGKDEAELTHSISRFGYNVQLVFAEQSGAYLADVRVRIADPKGAVVLDTVAEGPMLLAKLPPGRYRVSAEANGQMRTADISTATGARRATLVWPATTSQPAKG